MTNILLMSESGAIDAARVIAVGSYKSKPMRRIWYGTRPEKRINLTFGRAMRTLLMLEGGYVAVSHRTPGEVCRVLAELKEGGDAPPWW